MKALQIEPPGQDLVPVAPPSARPVARHPFPLTPRPPKRSMPQAKTNKIPPHPCYTKKKKAKILRNPHPPLGELVDALLRGCPARLDHVEDTLLVGHQARHLAHDVPDHLHALAEALIMDINTQRGQEGHAGGLMSCQYTRCTTDTASKRRRA